MITYRKHAVKSSSSSLVTSITETHWGVPANSAPEQCTPMDVADPAVPVVTSLCCHGPWHNCHCKSCPQVLLKVTAGSSYGVLRLTGLVQAAFIHLGKSSFPPLAPTSPAQTPRWWSTPRGSAEHSLPQSPSADSAGSSRLSPAGCGTASLQREQQHSGSRDTPWAPSDSPRCHPHSE